MSFVNESPESEKELQEYPVYNIKTNDRLL